MSLSSVPVVTSEEGCNGRLDDIAAIEDAVVNSEKLKSKHRCVVLRRRW